MVVHRFIFAPRVIADYTAWASLHRPTFNKISELLKDIARSPFEGKGKPEALKHQYSGFWSRRITDEHRLIYRATAEGDIEIVSCRGHYD